MFLSFTGKNKSKNKSNRIFDTMSDTESAQKDDKDIEHTFRTPDVPKLRRSKSMAEKRKSFDSLVVLTIMTSKIDYIYKSYFIKPILLVTERLHQIIEKRYCV